MLARIEALNPRLNAFCLVAADAARAAAREAEIAVMKGEPLGPLHGVPLLGEGRALTRAACAPPAARGCSPTAFPSATPSRSGACARAARCILGKTNTSEFGHKALTENPLFGVTRNPWDLERTPGGSSGGAAAAVAARPRPASALGTDGGGSVRIPAAFCGVFGFKPSYGRVPERPALPAVRRVGHVGPHHAHRARRGGGARRHRRRRRSRSHLAAAGGRLRISTRATTEVKGLHVAWSARSRLRGGGPEVLAVCENAAAEFESLGCHVEVVSPGWENPEECFGTMIAAQFYAAWSDRLPAARAAHGSARSCGSSAGAVR